MQQNKTSTALLDILLLILRPIYPPTIPEAIIIARAIKSVLGTEAEASVNIKLAVWAKKIIYNEFKAAVLVFIEKKKYKITKLIGPPPIPRNEEKIPRIRPMDRVITIECTFKVLILFLFNTYKKTPRVSIIIITL